MYYFPDSDFSYGNLFKASVRKERINKIFGSEFSTRNEGERYERERFIGFTTEHEARQYCIKKIKERLKQIKADAKQAIASITMSKPHERA